MSAHFSIVNFRHPEGSDAGSLVTDCAIDLGATVDIISSQKDELFSNFNYGNINWRDLLQNKHWLVNSSTTVLQGISPSNAWGASMIFGELEGTKTVMVVDVPADVNQLSEMWGSIINRIRQIHILFFTSKALDLISKLENTSNQLLLSKIRLKGLVPIVCTYDDNKNIAQIAHSSGEISVKLEIQLTYYYWLANFINGLSLINSNKDDILHAASYLNNRKNQII
ncbi:MAG: hypothetical protein CND89_00895 [Marine Group II euryarchaeote MED-G38]|nr:hypothetical protein [Euryarchaeota archaeon]OUV27782.1 MAG: hypothetical protein CBC57_00095 [Euryarchaeota archaeon TMED97]PDH23617.1 MAG: hypothetical protein CND89_00895 [Marine Group II euryarchaeote MED-G38]|tara:strand:+ start:26641 stop:27315 length:675 start_codon:yes stop_codon:yes gene_type:complete